MSPLAHPLSSPSAPFARVQLLHARGQVDSARVEQRLPANRAAHSRKGSPTTSDNSGVHALTTATKRIRPPAQLAGYLAAPATGPTSSKEGVETAGVAHPAPSVSAPYSHSAPAAP